MQPATKIPTATGFLLRRGLVGARHRILRLNQRRPLTATLPFRHPFSATEAGLSAVICSRSRQKLTTNCRLILVRRPRDAHERSRQQLLLQAARWRINANVIFLPWLLRTIHIRGCPGSRFCRISRSLLLTRSEKRHRNEDT